MSTVAFPITVFYDSSGEPIAYGHVSLSLTEDVYSPVGQVCASIRVIVPLDDTGTMISIPQVYPCSDLVPSDVQYVLLSYTASGERVSGPDYITV